MKFPKKFRNNNVFVDLTVISLIESCKMDNKDFIRTESYSLRLKSSGTNKVTEEFNNWMNKKVPFKKQSVMWSYALLLKTKELAQSRTKNQT
jgi:CRISPR-associated protein, Cas1 family